MKRLVSIILNFMIKNNVISKDTEEIEFYRYGIEITLSSLINIVLISIIGIVTNYTFESMMFLAVFIIMRSFTGGYHANTYIKSDMEEHPKNCEVLLISQYYQSKRIRFELVIFCAEKAIMNSNMNFCKSIVLIIILLSINTSLISCGKDSDNKSVNKSQTNNTAYINGFCMTNEQVIFSENGVMCYYDFDSKEKGVLCSKPNCEHKPFDSTTNPDPVCNAVTDEGTEYTALIYSDDFVYAVTDNTANSKLYKYDIKNDTKKMIAEFDSLVSGNALLSDDKFIMQIYSLNFDETGLGDTNGSTYNFCIYD